MAKTNLKRMNRFELLELMYKIVTENEKLTKRCDELERQLGYGGYRSARESPRDYYDEPRTMSRRDEILARMDEQTSQPTRQREADVPSGRASPTRRTAPAAPAARRVSQPAEEESAPSSRVRQSPAPAARPQQRPAAQPKAPASRPAPQPAPHAPAKAAQMPPDDDFDIDSILEDYFSDLPLDGKGRDA